MLVDKDTKKLNLFPIFSYKTSWDFTKKEECDNIIKNWQISFQASDLKRKHFLNLLDVVATTRHSRTNDLTMSKAFQWAIK